MGGLSCLSEDRGAALCVRLLLLLLGAALRGARCALSLLAAPRFYFGL